MNLARLQTLLVMVCLPGLLSFTKPPFREVDINAMNYAFQVPPTLPAGLTAFRLVNQGSVPHEVQLFRLRRGVSADSVLRMLAVPGQVAEKVGDPFGSVLVAGPGQTATERILIDLKKNEVYALVCGFQDTPTSPHHRKLGMFAAITVK